MAQKRSVKSKANSKANSKAKKKATTATAKARTAKAKTAKRDKSGPEQARPRRASSRNWSRAVTEHSHALDLERQVFRRNPVEMARSLKRSAEHSTRRRASAFQSAMSMLTFYANRAGRNLPSSLQRKVERAKQELRKLFHREPSRA